MKSLLLLMLLLLLFTAGVVPVEPSKPTASVTMFDPLKPNPYQGNSSEGTYST